MKVPNAFWVIAGIVCLAFFLRIYKVSSLPPSLSWDEVSIGYNAYSIVKTGFDEHHKFLPLDAFIAYGDYKPPIPIYLTTITVALFGLTEFAVRLPSVIAGTLSVLMTYFVVREFFSSHKKSVYLAMLSALLLAISPWHIVLSRAGFEANIAVLFVLLGVLFVLQARSMPNVWYVCWLPFTAAIYTFNSARYFAPILAIVLIWFAWPEVKESSKKFLIGMGIGIIFLLPTLPYLLSPESRLRFKEVNIFTDASVVEASNSRSAADGNSFLSKIFHNRRIGYARSYLLHFLDNVQPSFLFTHGDGNPKFSLQDVGQLYLVELPFLALGIFFLLRDYTKIAIVFILWVVASILPAATARETPHALRIENSLPVWQMVGAFGFLSFTGGMSKHKKTFMSLGIACILCLNFSYFWYTYTHHYANEYSGEWQYGYREAIRYIAPIKNQYQRIDLTESIGRAYMYVLFYEQYDPQSLWRDIDGSFDAAGFYNARGLGKYRFVRDGIGEYNKKTLYILLPSDVPTNARILTTIKRLNGDPALVIFDTP